MLKNKKRGFGWRPDRVDPRDYSTDLLQLGSTELPDAVSLRPFVTEVYNQAGTSSCVAQAVAGAIQILENRAGLQYLPISRLFLYWNSRKFHFAQWKDEGTFIRTCIKGLSRFGAPDEKFWPWSTSWFKLNRSPGWEAFMRAFPRRGGAYYRVDAVGPARVLEIRKALAEGLPVVFGTSVGTDFLKDGGDYVIDTPHVLDIVGGHAMVIIGYAKRPDGSYLFETLNSWGKGWRSGGVCWLTEKYITWEKTRDFTVCFGWQRLQA
jgi:C1A family cysteine protease